MNPAVTLPTILTGHTGLVKGCIYIVMQLAGAALGSLLLVWYRKAAPFAKQSEAFFCKAIKQFNGP